MVAKKKPRKVIFPIDCMKGKSKKHYMNVGKVEIYNMYEDIKNVPSLKELREMDKTQAKRILETVRTKQKSKNLIKHFGISSYEYNEKVLREFGIKTSARKKSTNKKVAPTKKNIAEKEIALSVAPTEIIEQFPVVKEFEGYEIKLSTVLEGEKLQNRIVNIMSMLDKEGKYKIKLLLQEVK